MGRTAPFSFRHSRTDGPRGSALILALLVLTIMFAMLAFVADIGYLAMLKSDAYTAVDAGALAAAAHLDDGRTAAESAMTKYANFNGIDGSKLATSNSGELTIEFGKWDVETATFTPTNDHSDTDAVRVTAWMTAVDAFFGRLLNKNTYAVRATSIAVKSAPLDIMLVLDLSGSMENHGRINALQHAAPKFVDAIEAIGGDHKIGVMGFSAPTSYNPASAGHSGKVYSAPGLTQPSNAERGVLESELTDDFSTLRSVVLSKTNLTADKYNGATGTGASIRDATHYLTTSSESRTGPSKIIVLMSDGHANKPDGSANDYALQFASSAKDQNVIIHTIALGSGADTDLLKSIASRAGGSFFNAAGNSAEQLKKTLQEAFERAAAAASRPVIVR